MNEDGLYTRAVSPPEVVRHPFGGLFGTIKYSNKDFLSRGLLSKQPSFFFF